MENPFQKKSGKKGFWMVGGAVGAVLLLAVAAARFGFHGNIAENGINLAKNGGAIVADAWKNLFGSATYDASPSGNINEGGDTASDTALFDDTDASLGDGASSSSDDAYENITSVIASPKTSSKKSVSSKKSASTNPSNAAGNENATATADIGANTSTSANTNTGANTNQNMNASSSASADTSTISNADSNAGAQASSSNAPSSASSSTSSASSSVAIEPCPFPNSFAPFASSASSTSSTKKIILNEIAWMGSPAAAGETAAAAANDEWIELKNISGSDLAMNGWQIENVSGGIKIIMSGSNVIPAGGFLLLARGSAGAVAAIASVHYSGALANTGDVIAVFDPQCNVSDFLNASSAWPGGDNTTKKTLERTRDHSGWQTSALPGGTPGAENSEGPASTNGGDGGSGSSNPVNPGGVGIAQNPATSSEQTGSAQTGNTVTFCPANHVVISDIQIAGAASANDVIKLYNPGSSSVDVSGWRLRKRTSGGSEASIKVFPGGSAVSPQGHFVWANAADGFAAGVGADVSSTETIAADNSIALFDASGTIVDQVAWGNGTNQWVEGHAFPTNPAANHVLERVFVNGVIGDSDDNANDFALH